MKIFFVWKVNMKFYQTWMANHKINTKTKVCERYLEEASVLIFPSQRHLPEVGFPRPGPMGGGTRAGVPPLPPGVPPWLGYPSAGWTWPGYPPTPQVWTDKQSETITFPLVLRTRSVNIIIFNDNFTTCNHTWSIKVLVITKTKIKKHRVAVVIFYLDCIIWHVRERFTLFHKSLSGTCFFLCEVLICLTRDLDYMPNLWRYGLIYWMVSA